MPLQKLTLKASEQHRGNRLDHVLASWLPEALARPLSKAKVRKLIVAGAVYLNGKRVRIASKIILPGARIEAYVDLQKLLSDDRQKEKGFVMGPEHVLYEDEYVIAVNKPTRLPTQPTLDESRENLFAAVKKFLAKRDNQPQPYLGLHHRLDRDTSGVVLFTKAQEANAGVAEAFSGHSANKTYLALAMRPRGKAVERRWSVKNYLGKEKGTGKKARFTAVRSGGDFAHTDFEILEETPTALLVEARPLTGRTHQIRVHLAGAGMPILGDSHYGGSTEHASRVMLHAACLTFPHPVHKTEVSVRSPLPEDFVQCLEALKQAHR